MKHNKRCIFNYRSHSGYGTEIVWGARGSGKKETTGEGKKITILFILKFTLPLERKYEHTSHYIYYVECSWRYKSNPLLEYKVGYWPNMEQISLKLCFPGRNTQLIARIFLQLCFIKKCWKWIQYFWSIKISTGNLNSEKVVSNFGKRSFSWCSTHNDSWHRLIYQKHQRR